MSLLGLLVLLVSLTLVQTGVLPKLALVSIRPDLVLLAVVAWAVAANTASAARAGIVGGLLLDLFGSAPLGTSVAGFVAALLLLRLGEAGGVRGDLLVALIMAFAATLVYDVACLLVLEAWGNEIAWATTFVNVVLPAAVLNALVMPIVYGTVWWLQQRLSRGAALAG